MSSWRQHVVLQILCDGAIKEMQVTFTKGTDTDSILLTDLVFGLIAGNSLVHFSQTIHEILIHLTTFPIPDASEPREVDGASGHC